MVFKPQKGSEFSERRYWYEAEEFGRPKILVVGCGNSGNNTVDRLNDIRIDGAQTMAVNTDGIHLGRVRAGKKVLVGRSVTRGLGSGGDPDLARRACETSIWSLKEALEGADLVFVTAGLGGGTGTGVSPLICEIARDKGATVVGMFSLPFEEGPSKRSIVMGGVEALQDVTNTLIIFDNNRILDLAPDLKRSQAFSVMDQLIAEITKGIVETITLPSLINLDFADVKTIMSEGGLSSALVGEGNVEDEAEDIVKKVLNNPMLDMDWRGATGCLLHITGGPDLSLKKAATVASTLTGELDPLANVIWGARVKEGHEGKISLMSIITGVGLPVLSGSKKSHYPKGSD